MDAKILDARDNHSHLFVSRDGLGYEEIKATFSKSIITAGEMSP